LEPSCGMWQVSVAPWALRQSGRPVECGPGGPEGCGPGRDHVGLVGLRGRNEGSEIPQPAEQRFRWPMGRGLAFTAWLFF
jgi:hypothetical protein